MAPLPLAFTVTLPDDEASAHKMRSRPIAPLLAVVATLTAPAATTAHTELIGTVPSDGASLATAPDDVSLEFSGELLPDGSSFVITDADGTALAEGSLDLDVADRNVLRAPFPAGPVGEFTVTWTSHAVDGHRAEGSMTFTIVGPPMPPDTSIAPPRPVTALLVFAGALLLGAAISLAVRAARPSGGSR